MVWMFVMDCLMLFMFVSVSIHVQDVSAVAVSAQTWTLEELSELSVHENNYNNYHSKIDYSAGDYYSGGLVKTVLQPQNADNQSINNDASIRCRCFIVQ